MSTTFNVRQIFQTLLTFKSRFIFVRFTQVIHVITQMAYALQMVLLKLSLLNCCDLKFILASLMMPVERSDIKFSLT